jgi:hypothetical protein
LVQTLERAEPIKVDRLHDLLEIDPVCKSPSQGRTDCEAHDFVVAASHFKALDFREFRSGTLLILQLADDDCGDAGAFDKTYGQSMTMQGCTDGITCIYREWERPWGQLSTDLGSNWNKLDCIKGVILATK